MLIRNAEVLNSKRIKQITLLLKEQWDFQNRLDCGFLQKGDDIFLVTRDIDKTDLKQLNVNSLGLYFGELRNEQLRLSIEGSQIIGPNAKSGVIELNDEQLQQWLRGEDILLNENDGTFTKNNNGNRTNGYVIIKHGNDFFGCGRTKDGKLLNFVPKARRLLK